MVVPSSQAHRATQPTESKNPQPKEHGGHVGCIPGNDFKIVVPGSSVAELSVRELVKNRGSLTWDEHGVRIIVEGDVITVQIDNEKSSFASCDHDGSFA